MSDKWQNVLSSVALSALFTKCGILLLTPVESDSAGLPIRPQLTY